LRIRSIRGALFFRFVLLIAPNRLFDDFFDKSPVIDVIACPPIPIPKTSDWSYIYRESQGEWPLRILIGINGASGVIYGIRLLQVLSGIKGVETHLIVTLAGEQTIEIETEYKAGEIKALAHYWYRIDDIAACPASGSFKHEGMIIAPCSMKTLSALAHSYADNLLTRAADVTLKERRRLLLLVRETPLHLGHLRNMVSVTEMGGIIMPPIPAFYCKPKEIQDIVDHTVGKALDLLNIEHNLFSRWPGAGNMA
jgi:4-hydroxy-3-polyprenylbenzoate decarboxylase